MNKDLRRELGKRLEEIAQEIKGLKRKRGEINRQYIPYVRNPLMGYSFLWGTRALRNLPQCKEPWKDYYRDLFFQDIRFKSKLSKINKKISFLEDDYQKTLRQIKEETMGDLANRHYNELTEEEAKKELERLLLNCEGKEDFEQECWMRFGALTINVIWSSLFRGALISFRQNDKTIKVNASVAV